MADGEIINDNAILEEPRIKQPSRKVVIEPLLVIFAIIAFPMSILSQLYIVDSLRHHAKEDWNNDSLGNETNAPVCGNGSNETSSDEQEVQKRAAQFAIFLNLASGIPSLVVTLFLGAYSDSRGRKFAILPPIIGGSARVLMYLLVLMLRLPLAWLLLGSFLEGLGGGYQTLLMGCFSYLADTVEPEKRQPRIVIAEMCMFFSGILGPLGVGIVIKKMGYLYPLLFVFGGHILCIFYVLFLVPETIIRRPPLPSFWSTTHIKATVTLFLDHTNRWHLRILLAAFTICATITLSSGVDTLFLMNTPLCWNSVTIGYYMSFYLGVCTVGGVIVAKLLKCCLSDNTIALIAGLCAMLYNVYKGFVANTAMMFAGIAISPFTVLFIPTIRALMSKLVDGREQGGVFGAIAFTEVICSIVGTIVLNSIYQATLHIASGIVFFYCASIYALGSCILGAYVFALPRMKARYQEMTADGLSE